MKEMLVLATAICASYFGLGIIWYLTTNTLTGIRSLKSSVELGFILRLSTYGKMLVWLVDIYTTSLWVTGIFSIIGVILILALPMP